MEITPLIGDLALSGAGGWALGYTAKKFFKLISLILGCYIASLIFLSSRGIIVVQWDSIGLAADGILSKISNLKLSVGLMGVGSVAGFTLGWRSG